MSACIKYEYDPSVLQFASRKGVNLSELDSMVDRSARISHPEGNRRFHDWLFDVEDGRVYSMQSLAPAPECATIKNENPANQEDFVVYEDCEVCGGEGCETCNFDGSYRVVRSLGKPRRFGVMN